jgi:hypothetical protein
MAALQEVPVAVMTYEGTGWWGAFAGTNALMCIQIWALWSNLPWFVHVAVAWYLIYRPFAIAMAGAYDEMDPTEVLRGIARCLLPYLGIFVASFIYGLLIWEIVLAVGVAAGPGMASLEIGQVEGVRIAVGLFLLFAYIVCYTNAIKYVMLGCVLRRYMGPAEIEVAQKRLTRVETTK